MLNTQPSFTMGIEEEYLLVDRQTGALIEEAPPTMLPECEKLLEGQVTPEFLQSQIEVGTRVCRSIAEARDDLTHLRRTVAQVADNHGLAMIAASTHPFATVGSQQTTRKERYQTLADDLQAVVRRLMISGMHVHVGLDDDNLRIDLLPQVAYVAPHLLALSTSSPFWEGQNTGLRSLPVGGVGRVAAHGVTGGLRELRGIYAPRRCAGERGCHRGRQQGLVGCTSQQQIPHVGDAYLRYLHAYRGYDLYRRHLCLLSQNAVSVALEESALALYSQLLIGENRWRAHRYGFDRGLIDFGRGVIVPYAELLEEMLEFIGEDAECLDCVAEVEHARTILGRGTSAHRQVAVYEKAIGDGAEGKEALQAVVNMLIEETAPAQS